MQIMETNCCSYARWKNYLEKLYVPHPLVGVMAQNTRGADKKKQVWMQNALKEQ